jgi:hypothetical protein
MLDTGCRMLDRANNENPESSMEYPRAYVRKEQNTGGFGHRGFGW